MSVGRPGNALSQQINAVGTIILARAVVELLKVKSMFECAAFHELFVRDVAVVIRQAHGETKIDLGIGIQSRGTELDDIAKALLGAVHAFYSVVMVRGSAQLLVCI